MSKSIVDELFDIALDPRHSFLPGLSGRSFTINNFQFTRKNLSSINLAQALPELDLWSGAKLRDLDSQISQVFSRFLEKIIEIREAEKAEAAPTLEGVFYDALGHFPAAETYAIVDPNSCRQVILFNETTGNHNTVKPGYIEKFVKFPKGMGPTYLPAREVYCPSLPSKLVTDVSKIEPLYPKSYAVVWNHYQTPENALATPLSDPQLHPALDKFFSHLFPNEESKQYVFRWLYTLSFIYGKPAPALLLCGKAAIGKNTLVESIMVGLVGQENYHKAAQLSERFNSSILNCVLHFSDEGELSGLTKRNMKGFHELFVAVERKGVDVGAPERIYARFVIATNNRRDLKMDYNDRKFSVPEVAETKLLDLLPPSDCEYLFKFKDNVEAQIEFRSWLKKYHAHDMPQEYYHGPLFKQLCYESLPSWFRTFLKMLEVEAEISLKEFKKRSAAFNISVDTVLAQIEAYEHEMNITLCRHILINGADWFQSVIYKGAPTLSRI